MIKYKYMSNFFTNRFKDANYIIAIGDLGEKRLFAVNHICIHEDCILFNDLVIPYGAKDIEKEGTKVIDDILQEIIHIIQSPENIEKKIIICGEGRSKRMLARKLEDRLKREVEY